MDGHPFGGNCIAAQCIKQGGMEEFQKLKEMLVSEFNDLEIEGLKISDLNLLNGFFVNLEYSMPSGQTVKLLDDNNVYLGNQIEIVGTNRCYGVVADETYLLVCEYGPEGKEPEIIAYIKRRTKIS